MSVFEASRISDAIEFQKVTSLPDFFIFFCTFAQTHLLRP